MYPIKNLEDLYDKEGYRDDQFDKMIKAHGLLILKWLFNLKGERMKSKGMVLYMNRNTKTTTGSI